MEFNEEFLKRFAAELKKEQDTMEKLGAQQACLAIQSVRVALAEIVYKEALRKAEEVGAIKSG